MSSARLEGYRAIDLAEAVPMLVAASGIDADVEVVTEIAHLVEREPPALRWASRIASTIGWRPLRERLANWTQVGTLVGSGVPWRADVERVRSTLSASQRERLAKLAACDAPFTWDVLALVDPTASIESLCSLEDAGFLVRKTRAGVVAFIVPYCVRAVTRLAHPDDSAAHAFRWLEAWVCRAEELRRISYGVSANATLAELAYAVTLAPSAMVATDPALQRLGLALWLAAADAIFFTGAVDFRSHAFARAVAIADAAVACDPQRKARVVAGRAALERGDAALAASLFAEALALANVENELHSEALRGAGWAHLASAKLDEAELSFERARHVCDAVRDPRGQSDASAGLGIVALLRGEPATAREHLEVARATHVVMRDTPRENAVREMMDLLPEHLETPASDARLRGQVEALRATGQRWREALVLARLALAARAQGDVQTERAHLAEARATATLANVAATKLVETRIDAFDVKSANILVGFEGRSLTFPSGASHDLSRHGSLRRLLWALARAMHERAGVAMSTLELVAIGWPGEKMRHTAGTLRVYTTIRRLRALGLADALLTRDDGYLIDPAFPLLTLDLQPA